MKNIKKILIMLFTIRNIKVNSSNENQNLHYLEYNPAYETTPFIPGYYSEIDNNLKQICNFKSNNLLQNTVCYSEINPILIEEFITQYILFGNGIVNDIKYKEISKENKKFIISKYQQVFQKNNNKINNQNKKQFIKYIINEIVSSDYKKYQILLLSNIKIEENKKFKINMPSTIDENKKFTINMSSTIDENKTFINPNEEFWDTFLSPSPIDNILYNKNTESNNNINYINLTNNINQYNLNISNATNAFANTIYTIPNILHLSSNLKDISNEKIFELFQPIIKKIENNQEITIEDIEILKLFDRALIKHFISFTIDLIENNFQENMEVQEQVITIKETIIEIIDQINKILDFKQQEYNNKFNILNEKYRTINSTLEIFGFFINVFEISENIFNKKKFQEDKTDQEISEMIKNIKNILINYNCECDATEIKKILKNIKNIKNTNKFSSYNTAKKMNINDVLKQINTINVFNNQKGEENYEIITVCKNVLQNFEAKLINLGIINNQNRFSMKKEIYDIYYSIKDLIETFYKTKLIEEVYPQKKLELQSIIIDNFKKIIFEHYQNQYEILKTACETKHEKINNELSGFVNKYENLKNQHLDLKKKK